jgi:predicted ferric reductase
MAILIAGIVALQFARAASWLTILFAALLSLHSVLFLIAFIYFMLKRPHSLRSETFDYKISELNLKREGDIEIKTSEFIQKRAGAIQAGLFEDVLDPSTLKRSSKPEGMKGPGKR